MPIFALANAGRRRSTRATVTDPVALAVARRTRRRQARRHRRRELARGPRRRRAPARRRRLGRGLRAAALLAGIGFTMALFIAGLAPCRRRRATPPRSASCMASAVAAVVGMGLLAAVLPRPLVRDPSQTGLYVERVFPEDGRMTRDPNRAGEVPEADDLDAPAAPRHPRGPQPPDRGRPLRSAASCPRRSTWRIACATS